MGPFVAVLQLHTTDLRRRKDADNRIKAVLDYCTRLGLVEDDSKAQIVVTGWVEDTAKAPHGACLTIYPYVQNDLPELFSLISDAFRVAS
jgi:Holliday junction resolvase RusA-like endonuclease